MLTGSSQVVKLVDFGTSLKVDVGKLPESRVQAAGVRGSPYWLAPECVRSAEYDLFKADIWSLGCTAIELLDGVPPFFQIKQAPAVIYHVSQLTRAPRPVAAVSAECLDFVLKCLQLDPTKRPEAAELLQHPWLQNAEACGQLSSLLPDETVLEQIRREELFQRQDFLSVRSSSLSSFIGRSPIQQKQLLLNLGGKNPSAAF